MLPMCMCRCWCIVYLAISAPKFSECTQCACAGVAAFFTWPFLCRNCQSVPNMNALVLLIFLPGHLCAQILRVRPMCMHWCCRIFYLAISAPKFSECAQCECAGVAALFISSFLHPKSQSAPNVNAPVLPHFLAGHFCTQILKVCPM